MLIQYLNILYHIFYNFNRGKQKILKGGHRMAEIRNLNGKRVCDISPDRRVVEIVQKDCLTRITANPDGSLNIEHTKVA